MMKILFSWVLFLASTMLSFAQTAYFQQKVNYQIQVQLDDKHDMLRAFIQMRYHNQSPDTLHFIYIHLWPNAYKNESTALTQQMLDQGNSSLYYATEKQRGFIDSLDFHVNRKPAVFIFDTQHIDYGKLMLPTPLLPGDSLLISTPFRVKIPSSEFSRLGHDGHSYQLTQWYPKPAVYDRKGWHPMPYLNQGEFYSEYGNFDVKISLPENYVVAASGTMVDEPSENAFIRQREENPLKSDSGKVSEPPSSSTYKTVEFQLYNAHDFAWFADKRYNITRKTIQLDKGREVSLSAYWLPEHREQWRQAMKTMKQALRFYSRRVGSYPWPVCKAVDGNLSAGAGMEYPTITVIGAGEKGFQQEVTLVHEIGHNWFYGILGFNERDYPWMDEGLNTFYQSLYESQYYGDKTILEAFAGTDIPALREKINLPVDAQYYYTYFFFARKNLDQPLSLPAPQYTEANYGAMVYYKTAALFRYLLNYLGEEEMDRLMHGFYQEWQFKHPQPEDFILYFKQHASKDLSWFFDHLLLTKDKIDYQIKSVKKQDDSLLVHIKNKGTTAAPFRLGGFDNEQQQQFTIWLPPVEKDTFIRVPALGKGSLQIDPDKQMPDINRNNNYAKTAGLLKTLTPPAIKPLYSIPFINKNPLYFFPAFAWNKYDGFMTGLSLYNDLIMERRWSFTFVPMYSFRSRKLSGEAGIYHNFYTSGFIRKGSAGLTARMYSYKTDRINSSNEDFLQRFYKIAPELRFYFKTPERLSSVMHQLSFRLIDIHRTVLTWLDMSPTQYPIPQNLWQHYSVGVMEYRYANKREINPYSILFQAHYFENMLKLGLTWQYSISFAEHRSLDFRLFAGQIFSYRNYDAYLPDFSLKSSSWSGENDYLYDYTFGGRSESTGQNLWAAQMIPAEGALSIPTFLGKSQSWLLAATVKSSLPIPLIKLYASVAVFPEQGKAAYLYEGGALLHISKEVVEVYFPLFWSPSIQEVMELNRLGAYKNKIRFVLNLNKMNPARKLRDLEL